MQTNLSKIIIIDDNSDIHKDYRKILENRKDPVAEALENIENKIFNRQKTTAEILKTEYQIDSAYQGEEGLKLIRKANLELDPYAIAFVDIRMPPGIDGIVVTKSILKETKNTQVILCSAYSDYSFDQIIVELGVTDRVMFLEKPFQAIEIQQLAISLSRKYQDLIELEKNRIKLIEQCRVAEEANSAKNLFLANISHEIRTPLTAIIGYAEKLESIASSTEEKECISSILTNSDHLLTIINDVLDLAKIESGVFDVENRKIELPLLIKEVFEILKIKAEQKDLYLISENLILDKFLLISDYNKLKQVLINLVGNAIKFTDKGGVKITSEVNSELQKILIKVEDSGIGIKTEYLKTIFNPFDQADNSITRRFGGTGLGLSISKKIIDELRGNIEVKSTANIGSTFILTLPVVKQNSILKETQFKEIQSLNSISDITQTKNTVKQIYKGNILVVDDSTQNRNLITYFLKSVGLGVTGAQNGEDALKIIEHNNFDVVLMDIQMPVMDGITATKKIRDSNSRIPIIALTANQLEHQINECLDAGCSAYLGKPFKRENLIKTVIKYIRD